MSRAQIAAFRWDVVKGFRIFTAFFSANEYACVSEVDNLVTLAISIFNFNRPGFGSLDDDERVAHAYEHILKHFSYSEVNDELGERALANLPPETREMWEIMTRFASLTETVKRAQDEAFGRKIGLHAGTLTVEDYACLRVGRLRSEGGVK